MAKDDNGGFLAGLVVGGLVGAALALLYTPRGGEARATVLDRVGALWGGDAEARLEQGRQALRARFETAASAAQEAAATTEQRLQDEYRAATQVGESAPRPSSSSGP